MNEAVDEVVENAEVAENVEQPETQEHTEAEEQPQASETTDEQQTIADNNSEEDIQEAIDQAEASGDENAVQELKKILKLKIDGKEQDFELDWNDEDSLKRYIQKGLAADKRMNEAALQQKQAQDALEYIKQNPEEALKHFGHDPEKLAETIIERKIKEMEMSPAEREKAELERKIQEYERELAEAKQKQEEEQRRAMQQKFQMELDQKITAALNKSEVLPKSDYSVKRVADALYRYTAAGYKVDVDQVVPIVEKQVQDELRAHVKNLNEDQILKVFGDELEQRLRQRRVQNVKKTPQKPLQDIAKAEEKEEPKKKIPMREFFKKL